MAWWLGTVKARDEGPKPEKRKPQASYVPIRKPPEQRPEPLAWGLPIDWEFYTPEGAVDAMAGDLVMPWGKDLKIVPPEKVPIGMQLRVLSYEELIQWRAGAKVDGKS